MPRSALPENSGPTPESGKPAAARWKRLSLRLGFALFVGLVALKLGDLLIGRMRDTQTRHLFRLAPNTSTRHETMEFDYVFTTNSLGFRGADISMEKPAGARRLVVLGDSFVAGVGVGDDATFTARLEKLLNAAGRRTEVVNLGRSGSSTIREFDIYERFGSRFAPDDVILVVFLGNDLAEIVEEHDRHELREWHPQGWLRRGAYAAFPNLYLELAMMRHSTAKNASGAKRSEQDLVNQLRAEAAARGVDPDVAQRRFENVPEKIRTAARAGRFSLTRLFHGILDPKRVQRSLNPEDAYFERAWPRMRKHLERLKTASRSDGARFRIVALPAAVQVDAAATAATRELGYEVDDAWRSTTSRVQRELQSWSESNGVSYFDLTDALRAADPPLFHVYDRHMNERGHAVTARALADWLRNGKPEAKARSKSAASPR